MREVTANSIVDPTEPTAKWLPSAAVNCKPSRRLAPTFLLSRDVAVGRECLPRGRRNYRMFPGRKRKAVESKQVVFRSWEGYGIAMFTLLATLNSVNNLVEISVKFPRVADFCSHTAILLMNATQMNILDAITSAK